MITNLRIELDDDQRRQLADLLDGKQTKRMASRADVCQVVEGFVGMLTLLASDLDLLGDDEFPEPEPERAREQVRAADPKVQAVVRRLESEGRSPGYIIGWLKGCKVYGLL